MSNSQEQSLNENVVFLPVDETSPQFLHSEREREAVERLLDSGPEAFYGSIGPDLSSYFLSPEEVSRISSWAQNYHFHEPLVGDQNGADRSVDSEKICSTYDPYQWDVPVPNLELGWPEKPAGVPKNSVNSVTVHSSHPAEGDLQIREVIRRHLQAAKMVIAVVTDQLTDNAIIFDLHTAASRGVPVYIILNQRSLQQNFTLNRLRHPYMRVRVLGGKTFCSRTAKMVAGEMKDNFILVDLEAAIHGNYSLTWTGAHLHRQLVTVLRGPVIDSFDREFRILFADSVPVPDTWGVTAGPQVYNHYQTKDFSRLRLLKQLSAESEITNPPSPPADVFLDWEAMGVLQRDSSRPASLLGLHKENIVEKTSQLDINKDSPTEDRFTHNEHLVWSRRRMNENTSPLTTGVTDNSNTINSNAEVLSTNSPATEGIKRPELLIERSVSRELSAEKQANKPERRIDVPPETTNKFLSKRRSVALMESFEEEDSKTDDVSPREHSSTSREKKPLILKVPHRGNFSSVSDIMKRLKQGTPAMLRKGMNSTMSDRTQSMMDLSENNHSDREAPVPRFLGNLNSDQMTPALALMQRRNDGVKNALNRPPANFMPTERPRSSTLNSTLSSGFYLRKLKSDKEKPAV
ncbi:PREDICTED: protein FAM83D-like [Poecilia mexicana]|uniref:Scaffolding anchor of CK1 domain-containing protein n=1 Tax=Poecilia mexicana TaxID=48701 RepID=A0A3B3YXC5_9TELE|nr:PREDICTED: protein FAM83D-like [Poecilia mexicana]XP_014854116.1 PREDICTED: protein FAM83D-like [Poecilia mexicana]